jgi:hypothetical protein
MPHPFEDSIHFEYHKRTEARKKKKEKEEEVSFILNPKLISLGLVEK